MVDTRMKNKKNFAPMTSGKEHFVGNKFEHLFFCCEEKYKIKIKF